MFSFWKKKERTAQIEKINPVRVEEAEMLSLYPVGTRVNYYGLDMLVISGTRHINGVFSGYITLPTIFFGIECEYINTLGEVKRVQFGLASVREFKLADCN